MSPSKNIFTLENISGHLIDGQKCMIESGPDPCHIATHACMINIACWQMNAQYGLRGNKSANVYFDLFLNLLTLKLGKITANDTYFFSKFVQVYCWDISI